MQHITAPAFKGIFQAGVLEAHAGAGLLACLACLGIFRDLGVEGELAVWQAKRIGIASEVDAG